MRYAIRVTTSSISYDRAKDERPEVMTGYIPAIDKADAIAQAKVMHDNLSLLDRIVGKGKDRQVMNRNYEPVMIYEQHNGYKLERLYLTFEAMEYIAEEFTGTSHRDEMAAE